MGVSGRESREELRTRELDYVGDGYAVGVRGQRAGLCSS